MSIALALVLIACEAVAADTGPTRSEKVWVVHAPCRDGQMPKEETGCDTDDVVNGICQYGRPQKPIRVPVGETQEMERHGVRAIMRCRAAARGGAPGSGKR